MESRPADHDPLSSIKTEIVVIIITSAVGFAITRFVRLNDDLKSLVVGGSVGLAVLLAYAGRHLQRWLGQRYMRRQSGITAVFDSLAACKRELQATFRNSGEVRLLLQIGRRELGDGDPSFFFPLAKELGSAGPRMRILRASTQSPFLSEARARRRRRSVEQWRTDMRILQEQINLLKQTYGARIEDREHCEPYLWRIFLFDDIAYVSGYLYTSDNDVQAPVYKLVKGEKSLFSVFDKYFEYLWEKYSVSPGLDANERWAAYA